MLNHEPTILSAGPFIIVLPAAMAPSRLLDPALTPAPPRAAALTPARPRTAAFAFPRPLPSRDRQEAVAAHCVHATQLHPKGRA